MRLREGLRAAIPTIRDALRAYLSPGGGHPLGRIEDRDGLGEFLHSRASYVAQTSLYGYLRTRAGMRYPELFDDDVFVVSINIAKWYVWLECLSDLSVFAGGLLARRHPGRGAEVGRLMEEVVSGILSATGVPEDAGEAFADRAWRVRERIAVCDWASVEDGEGPFLESPAALVRYAPIVDELKQLDEGIVRNSVRFRWQGVRRELRKTLDADALMDFAGR